MRAREGMRGVARGVAVWLAIGCGDGEGSDDGQASLTASPTTTEGSGPEATGNPPGSGDSQGGSAGPMSATDGADSGTTAPPETTGDPPPPSGCGDPPVWCPMPGVGWQWQLTGAIDASFDVAMYDIDVFDTEAGQIGELVSEGRTVICYFSAGSHEDWRPDAGDFPGAAIGSQLDQWPGEHWLDIRDDTVRSVLAARLDLAVDKGCDGVEPDNVDGYANDTGFPLTADDQLDFNRWLAEAAHARGLSVGLKNDLDQIDALLPHFDWALDEECMAYDECDLLAPFIDAGKAVFHVEYVDDPAQGAELAAQVCPDALARSFSTLIKGWDLDAWRIACE